MQEHRTADSGTEKPSAVAEPATDITATDITAAHRTTAHRTAAHRTATDRTVTDRTSVGRTVPRRRGRARAWAPALLVLLGLMSYLAALPAAWLSTSTAPYRTTAGRVPVTPVAIVLGAGLDDEGRPMPFLSGRLRTAADLYRRGKVRVILVTGDNSRKDYDEPTAMRDFLLTEGIPADRIVLDYAGFDTWDSCVRAHKIFGVDRATVVTQRFHLPRAVALCRAAGIEAYGVGHDTMAIDAATTQYGYFREFPAAFKALGDLITKPTPQFLGPPEPGVRQALLH